MHKNRKRDLWCTITIVLASLAGFSAGASIEQGYTWTGAGYLAMAAALSGLGLISLCCWMGATE